MVLPRLRHGRSLMVDGIMVLLALPDPFKDFDSAPSRLSVRAQMKRT